jgi:hypothetical protein
MSGNPGVDVNAQCCAKRASPAAPPRNVMNSRRFIDLPPRVMRRELYQAAVALQTFDAAAPDHAHRVWQFQQPTPRSLGGRLYGCVTSPEAAILNKFAATAAMLGTY